MAGSVLIAADSEEEASAKAQEMFANYRNVAVSDVVLMADAKAIEDYMNRRSIMGDMDMDGAIN